MVAVMSPYRPVPSQSAPLAAAAQRPASWLRLLGAWRRDVDRRMAIRARRAWVRVCHPAATWRECQDLAAAIHDGHEANDRMERADAQFEAALLERTIERAEKRIAVLQRATG